MFECLLSRCHRVTDAPAKEGWADVWTRNHATDKDERELFCSRSHLIEWGHEQFMADMANRLGDVSGEATERIARGDAA